MYITNIEYIKYIFGRDTYTHTLAKGDLYVKGRNITDTRSCGFSVKTKILLFYFPTIEFKKRHRITHLCACYQV